MRPALQLQIGQQLTLTPQLQQAIRLLQLSTLDLQLEIQDMLESNPMLDTQEDNSPSTDTENSAENLAFNNEKESVDESLQAPTDVALQQGTLGEDLPVDCVWEDTYALPVSTSPGTNASSSDAEDGFSFLANSQSAPVSLQEHLRWQCGLTPFTELDNAIAIAIIDAIDNDGFLTSSLEDIHTSLAMEDVELDEIEAVLHRTQQFDPPGVGARDLGECLLIQLRQLSEDVRYRQKALTLVEKHLDLLAKKDYKQLQRELNIKQSELEMILALLQTLNPRPGSQISPDDTQYIVPDVEVKKEFGRWVVRLNGDVSPKLRINQGYSQMIRRADNSRDNTYMKNQLQEARWFLKSLQSRNETLLKVATCIVEKQKEFLEKGPEAMRPLILHDVAEEVEMHESTISRVTTQKYIHTPKGVFELKYFFSSHLNTASGGECSSTAIRALIKKLVDSENTIKPYSDNKIAQLLNEKGIKVARRTVAKYREAMAIPPSNERRSLG